MTADPAARDSAAWPAQTTAEPPERPLRPAILRGLRLKCPRCGTGPMMRSYLTTRDHCPVCGQALSGHRADDGPAYMTILVCGHLMAPLILWVFTTFRPEPLVLASTFSLGFTALALFLLPRFKGMFVAIQWSRRMHGFALDEDESRA